MVANMTMKNANPQFLYHDNGTCLTSVYICPTKIFLCRFYVLNILKTKFISTAIHGGAIRLRTNYIRAYTRFGVT